MRTAYGRHGSFAWPSTGADGLDLVGAILQQPKTFSLFANDASPDPAAPGCGDDARDRHPAGDDGKIDGKFIAAGKELPRAIEGVNDQKASIKTIVMLACDSSETTGTPGRTRATPWLINASDASSAAVTGE